MAIAEQARPLNMSRFDTWIFDLDNTLYPASSNLFSQIDRRMKTFISEVLDLDLDASFKLQKKYYREYGTTLRGLMLNHDVDPDAFLDFVHDIDHTVLSPDPILGSALDVLPGRRLVYTNGSASHAKSVLEALEIIDRFEEIFDIRAGNYVPKPSPSSYQQFLQRYSFDPNRAVMFEDSAKNLEPAADMGMVTVLVTDKSILNPGPNLKHCHFITEDLKSWLAMQPR